MYGNGYQINRVAISGSHGPRASLFAPATKEIFGLGATMGFNPVLAAIALGQQQAQDYYNDAKQEISKWDMLVSRVAKMGIGAPGKEYRDKVIADFGLAEPTNKDKGQYMRNALATDVANADRYSPTPAYEEGFPSHGPSRGRVKKLRNFNSDLADAITYGETNYGINPEPVVIERLVQGPSAPGSSPWPYVIVGGGVVVALAIAGII